MVKSYPWVLNCKNFDKSFILYQVIFIARDAQTNTQVQIIHIITVYLVILHSESGISYGLQLLLELPAAVERLSGRDV